MDRIVLDSYKYKFGGQIEAIASKSFAHRLLIAAALSDETSEILCNTTSKDIEATISCLNAMGAKIVWRGKTLAVTPIDLQKADGRTCSIDCNESGSTLRFLLPILGVLGLEADIHMHGRLSERPLSPLYEEMEAHGCILSPQGTNPLKISHKMEGGIYTIAGNISSQYITGLLFALPNAKQDSEIRVTGALQSRPYVDITLSVLRDFGIQIEEIPCRSETVKDGEVSVIFRIPAGQIFHPEKRAVVEGDWSNAAFFLTAGAINRQPITVTGLNMNSLQGDRAILTLLQDFGAETTIAAREDGLVDITVSEGGDGLRAIEIDAQDIPDLVPILSVAAAFAKGKTRICNIERLRIKESDRVKTVVETLGALGVQIEEENACIVVLGRKSIEGGTVDSANDHRIAMMAAIASMRSLSSVEITNPMAVAKSYPQFYDEFRKLYEER